MLYLCFSGGTGNSVGRGVRGLRRPFGADRDRDSPHDTEHARNSPVQFLGDNAVMGPVVPIQQQRHKSRKLFVSFLCWCIVSVHFIVLSLKNALSLYRSYHIETYMTSVF